jgi:hypothetical protein
MSVSAELLCSFELLKPLDSSALKSHIKKGRSKRQSMLNSPVSIPYRSLGPSEVKYLLTLVPACKSVPTKLSRVKRGIARTCSRKCTMFVSISGGLLLHRLFILLRAIVLPGSSTCFCSSWNAEWIPLPESLGDLRSYQCYGSGLHTQTQSADALVSSAILFSL